MRVVVAPDSFKGTLTAREAARAIATGWRRGDPSAGVEEVPVADGGEGTLDALITALEGRLGWVTVTGPLGDPVEAAYGLVESDDGLLGVIEMARASGLELSDRRDPMRATTFGTGELILAAAKHVPERILVCIGGSATTDGGGGMAQALGVRLVDDRDNDLTLGGAALRGLARIDMTGLAKELREVDVLVATDVDNPLTGPAGASAVYGPQKGATAKQVAVLDEALGHLAAVINRDLGIDVRDVPGAGAAGGLGAGLVAFLGARLRPGFDLVAEILGLRQMLEHADVVVTGEGSFDAQTEHGKAPAGVLRMAREAGCRTVLIAGQVKELGPAGIDLIASLEERVGLEAALDHSSQHLEEAGEEAARSLAAAAAEGL